MAAPLDVGQWVALGFSEQGEMIKSTAIIVWIARGLPRVRTYYLRDKVESAVVPDATRITFVAGPELSYDSKQKTVFMAFQIDFAKSLAKPNFLLYAQGQESADDAPMQHNVQWMDKSSFPTGTFLVSSPHVKLHFSCPLLRKCDARFCVSILQRPFICVHLMKGTFHAKDVVDDE